MITDTPKRKQGVPKGTWRGKRAIYEHNPKTFVQDWYKVRTILVMVPRSFGYVSVKRADVWELAKKQTIHYTMDSTLLKSGRTVMIIF